MTFYGQLDSINDDFCLADCSIIAATAATTFALNTAIGLALWWTQATREPEQARASVPVAMGRGPLIGAQEAKEAREEANGPTVRLATPPASFELSIYSDKPGGGNTGLSEPIGLDGRTRGKLADYAFGWESPQQGSA